MEDNIKSVSTDLFYKIRSRFSGLKLGSELGEVTINPEEAVFFDFDYMEGENPIGHVSISLAEPGNMKVYYSTGIAENMDAVQKDSWYDFLRGLREFAKRRLMSFDTRDITKDNLDQRDFSFLSQYATNTPVGEGIMKEGMYGTNKTSYQKLENTRLIIKHNHQVDETSPGARTRNIGAMFIENGDGERFKYPFIHLAGARAMQRHVQEGGMPYDDIGKHIIGISEKIAHLKNFGNYVVRNDLMNSETNDIVSRTQDTLDNLRETVKKLAKKSHYEQFKSQFQAEQIAEVPEEFIEDLTNKFTVKNFKEDIKAAFPIIYSLMQTKEDIHYDDIVAMTQPTNEEVELDLETTEEFNDPFTKFEAWAMNLGEDNAITSQDEEEQAAAVEKLQSLVGEHFPAGVDGQNAISSLKGIIDDPQLAQEIKAAAKEDADTCVRPLVYQWLQDNAPEVVDELDFGDMDMPADSSYDDEGGDTDDAYALASAGHGSDEDYGDFGNEYEANDPNHPEYDKQDDYDLPPSMRGKGTDKYRLPDTDKHDDRHARDFRKRSGQEESVNVQEIAEFMYTGYDPIKQTFPKGPQAMCTMVGKKFGPQAESVAREFVLRMAPKQNTQVPQVNELARIKELSGL
jgi:hypothetical protein